MTRAHTRLLALAAALLGAPGRLGADNIRGLVTAELAIRAEAQFEQTATLRHGELVVVSLPPDTRFLERVQLELVLSAEARTHYDSFGFVIYDRLDATPVPGQQSLTGRRAFLHHLLAMNRLFFIVDLSESPPAPHDLTQGIFHPPEPHAVGDFPVLVGVVPIMKGTPDAVDDLLFYLRARPILRNAGSATLRVLPPPGTHTFTVFLDDAPIGSVEAGAAGSPWEKTAEIEAGIHTLRVTSPTLQPAETAFSVEPGGTNTVEVQLRELAASLFIEAPRGTSIYVDGARIDYPRESRVGLTVGEHTIRFKLGDYSGTRTFTVAEGKSYTIYVEMNISVKED